MKEPYTEELATRGDPESCAVHGNVHCEALTGAHTGEVLSCEMPDIGSADAVPHTRKATSVTALSRAVAGLLAVRDPLHVGKLHAREPGDPAVPQAGRGAWLAAPR